MLCYRCGSHVPDTSKQCTVCGQALSDERRRRATQNVEIKNRGNAPFEEGFFFQKRYELKELIGIGTIGWLYRARDAEVDIDVALKVIASKLTQAEIERTNFIKIARKAKKVQHPNIVRIYESGFEHEHCFYTMPYVQGLSLQKVISLRKEHQRVFEPSEVASLFSQIAGAIDGLKGESALCCIKPSNVIVLPDILKITGLPEFIGLPRTPYAAMQKQKGVDGYLAPEARYENARVDRRADIYSMTAILAEMLTGYVPARERSFFDEKFLELPERIQQALKSGLAPSLDDRAGSAFEVIAPLFEEDAPEQETHLLTPAMRVHQAHSTPGRRLSGIIQPLKADDDSLMFDLEEDDIKQAALEEWQPIVSTAAKQSSDGRMPKNKNKQEAKRELQLMTDAPTDVSMKKESSLLWIFLLAVITTLVIVFAFLFLFQSPTPYTSESIVAVGENDSTDAEPGKQSSVRTKPLKQNRKKAIKKRQRTQVPPPKPRSVEVKPKPKAKPSVPPDTKMDNNYDAVVAKQVARSMATNAVQAMQVEKTISVEKVPETTTRPPITPADTTKKKCPDGMVFIDSGPFMMGTAISDPMRGFNDLELKSNYVKGFCIDKYEYPNKYGEKPRANINWFQAKRLCQGQGKRLCLESEWEKSCKGKGGYRFPYGNRFNPGSCNVGTQKVGPSGHRTLCKSAYGVFDLAGNVAEWTASKVQPEISNRVYKGGAASLADWASRCSARFNQEPGSHSQEIGVRCCADPN